MFTFFKSLLQPAKPARAVQEPPARSNVNLRREALRHPTNQATKNLMAEITAECMAEEWIEEVRNGAAHATPRAKHGAKLPSPK